MIPDGDRDLGRAAILVDDDAQAIGQRELLEGQHLVGVRGLDERKRRGRGRQQEAGTDHKEKLLSYLRGKPGRLVRDKNSRPEGKWTSESDGDAGLDAAAAERSEEHTSELQSLMRISYAVFCLKNNTIINHNQRYENKRER